MLDEIAIARFESKYMPEPNSGCWLWLECLNTNGYGVFNWSKPYPKQFLAHRLAYRIYRGEIPGNLGLDHLCRVRCCINPWHLEAVTQRENLLRGLTGPGLNAKKTHCLRGHSLSGPNLYMAHGGGRVCRNCRRDERREYERRRRLLGTQPPRKRKA